MNHSRTVGLFLEDEIGNHHSTFTARSERRKGGASQPDLRRVLLENYANKPWHKLHEALTEWGNKLADCFQVEGAFPADYQPSNMSVGKGTIEKIRRLKAQGIVPIFAECVFTPSMRDQLNVCF